MILTSHLMLEAYSEHCQTSKMERFAKIAKRSILDICKDSEYTPHNIIKHFQFDARKSI